MVKTATKAEGACKSTRTKKGALGKLSLPALQTLLESGKKANLNSGGTQANYSGQIAQGCRWLESHFTGNTDSAICPQGMNNEIDDLEPIPMTSMWTLSSKKHSVGDLTITLTRLSHFLFHSNAFMRTLGKELVSKSMQLLKSTGHSCM